VPACTPLASTSPSRVARRQGHAPPQAPPEAGRWLRMRPALCSHSPSTVAPRAAPGAGLFPADRGRGRSAVCRFLALEMRDSGQAQGAFWPTSSAAGDESSPCGSAFGAVAALVCALALGLVLRFVVHAGAAGRRSRPPRPLSWPRCAASALRRELIVGLRPAANQEETLNVKLREGEICSSSTTSSATGRPGSKGVSAAAISTRRSLGVSHFRLWPQPSQPRRPQPPASRRRALHRGGRLGKRAARRGESWSCTRGTCCAWHPRWLRAFEGGPRRGLEVIAVGGVRPEGRADGIMGRRSRGRTPNDVPAARGPRCSAARAILLGRCSATAGGRRRGPPALHAAGRAKRHPPACRPRPRGSGSAKRPRGAHRPANRGNVSVWRLLALIDHGQRAGWGRPHRAGRSHAARPATAWTPTHTGESNLTVRPQPDSAEGRPRPLLRLRAGAVHVRR